MNVCFTPRHFGRHLQIFAPCCPHTSRRQCHKQLHHACVHGRAAVAIHGRNGRSGDAKLEVHLAIPTLLLHPSGANNCATGGTRPVRTQGGSGTPTVGVVRAHWRSGEVRRVLPGQKIVEITLIDDERVLHTTPFRSAPTSIWASLSSHVTETIPQAAASRARPWACCRVNTLTENGIVEVGPLRIEDHLNFRWPLYSPTSIGV